MPVSPPPSAILGDILGPTTQVTRRVELYESDGETLWIPLDDIKGRLLSGSVGVTYGSDVRRTLDISLNNQDKILNPNPDNGFWYDKIVKAYRGIVSPTNGSWECQIGEFMIDRIDTTAFPHSIKVTGRDYVKKCQLSKFTTSTTFKSGSAVEVVIDAIAANAGITKKILPVTGKVLGTDYAFDRGTTRWDAMTQITDAYGYELFFDATGYLILREYQDPIASPLAFTFETGIAGTLASVSRSTNDTQLYNHVLVTGENSDTTIPLVAAEAFNTEPTSPTNIDRIGDRLYQYSSSFITTTLQAQDVAAKFLKIHALEQFEMSISSIVLPWLDAGSIISILYNEDTVDDPNTPTRFLLDSLTVPMGLEEMSATGKRVTIISDNGVSIPQYQASDIARFPIFGAR